MSNACAGAHSAWPARASQSRDVHHPSPKKETRLPGAEIGSLRPGHEASFIEFDRISDGRLQQHRNDIGQVERGSRSRAGTLTRKDLSRLYRSVRLGQLARLRRGCEPDSSEPAMFLLTEES